MVMNIVIGVDSIKHPMSGVGVYSYELCKQYILRDDVNVVGLGRYSIFDRVELEEKLRRARIEPWLIKGANRVHFSRVLINRLKSSNALRRAYHSTSKLAALKHLNKLDQSFIYHVPNFIGYGNSYKKVVTIHDLSHIDCEGMHPPSRVKFMRDQLSDSIASARRIIVDSEFTRERLLESGLIDRNRENDIFRVYLGIRDAFSACQPASENSVFFEHFCLKPQNYFLALGTIEPRKNYVRLVRAYSKLPQSVALQFPLVICGALGWGYEAFLELVASIKPPHRVVLTGHVSQADISFLVSNALAFVYPSIYEGFGMPVLEAMKCGVPVITSGVGATLEVSSDAALHVDPLSVEEISDAMMLMSSSESTAKDYAKKGTLRSSEFSWGQCAAETLDVYKTLN